jgi:serine/threonine protein kinase
MTKEIATLHWRAPEVILDNLTYCQAVDMWSIGVVIYECLTGQLPFEGKTEIEYLLNIFKRKGIPTEHTALFFKKSPVLRMMFERLPKFQRKGFGPDDQCEDDNKNKLLYGFGQLIDDLTMIDPGKRPNCA